MGVACSLRTCGTRVAYIFDEVIQAAVQQLDLRLGQPCKKVIGQFKSVFPLRYGEDNLVSYVFERLVNSQALLFELREVLEGKGQVQALLTALLRRLRKL